MTLVCNWTFNFLRNHAIPYSGQWPQFTNTCKLAYLPKFAESVAKCAAVFDFLVGPRQTKVRISLEWQKGKL